MGMIFMLGMGFFNSSGTTVHNFTLSIVPAFTPGF
jgi:hypothetical protein